MQYESVGERWVGESPARCLWQRALQDPFTGSLGFIINVFKYFIIRSMFLRRDNYPLSSTLQLFARHKNYFDLIYLWRSSAPEKLE